MDAIILAASLISFFALIAGWLVLPASNEATVVAQHGVTARA